MDSQAAKLMLKSNVLSESSILVWEIFSIGSTSALEIATEMVESAKSLGFGTAYITLGALDPAGHCYVDMLLEHDSDMVLITLCFGSAPRVY